MYSPIPAHRRTDMVSPTWLRWPSRTGQRSGSPTGCAVLEQTDREESEPDQPIPGGELLVGCSMRRQIACTQLGLLSIILSAWTHIPFLLKVLYNTNFSRGGNVRYIREFGFCAKFSSRENNIHCEWNFAKFSSREMFLLAKIKFD